MRCRKLQAGMKIFALAACVSVPAFCAAQNPHANRPPQPAPPVHQSPPHPNNQNRPPANPNRTPYNPPHPNQGPNNNFNNGTNNRNGVRNGAGANYAPTPRQQLGVGAARPWVDQMRDLSPQQRDRVLQNSKAFQNLSPDKQSRIRQQFNQWDNMPASQRADLRQK